MFKTQTDLETDLSNQSWPVTKNKVKHILQMCVAGSNLSRVHLIYETCCLCLGFWWEVISKPVLEEMAPEDHEGEDFDIRTNKPSTAIVRLVTKPKDREMVTQKCQYGIKSERARHQGGNWPTKGAGGGQTDWQVEHASPCWMTALDSRAVSSISRQVQEFGGIG